ncbi:MAG: hypothetical protein K2W82_14015 [Candidatus Obscuribacterales bacterium]|nr:hypothetical protein [Candidatus Obscuribacterales bacterium]
MDDFEPSKLGEFKILPGKPLILEAENGGDSKFKLEINATGIVSIIQCSETSCYPPMMLHVAELQNAPQPAHPERGSICYVHEEKPVFRISGASINGPWLSITPDKNWKFPRQ